MNIIQEAINYINICITNTYESNIKVSYAQITFDNISQTIHTFILYSTLFINKIKYLKYYHQSTLFEINY